MKKKCLSSSALLIAIAALCSVNSGCKSPDNNREIVGGIKKFQDEMNREKLPESHLENIQAYALNQLGDDQNEINLIEKNCRNLKKVRTACCTLSSGRSAMSRNPIILRY